MPVLLKETCDRCYLQFAGEKGLSVALPTPSFSLYTITLAAAFP